MAKPQPEIHSFDDIKIGDRREFSKIISAKDVDIFAKLVGDYNPLHMDDEYAKKTRFKSKLVHGMLIASHFSTIVGMHLPGRNCLYLTQEVSFKKPIKINDKVKILGEVTKKINSVKILKIKTQAINQHNEVVVDGYAKVMVLDENLDGKNRFKW